MILLNTKKYKKIHVQIVAIHVNISPQKKLERTVTYAPKWNSMKNKRIVLNAKDKFRFVQKTENMYVA